MEIEARKHVLAFPVIFSVFTFVVVVSEKVEGNDRVEIDNTDKQTNSEHELFSVVCDWRHDCLEKFKNKKK